MCCEDIVSSMWSAVLVFGILATFILQTKTSSDTIPRFRVPVEVQGYPAVTPENSLIYSHRVETSTSLIQTGYSRVTPEIPFTYPRPVETSASAIQTGYSRVTPEIPFTYPRPVETSTSAIQTGYPRVTPETPFTYPPPAETSTSAIQTGYSRITPEIPFTYPPPAETSTSAIQTGYPRVTPETPFTYPRPVETSTSAIQTGYPRVTPETPFTYPPPLETSTSVIQTGYSKFTPANRLTYSSAVQASTANNVKQEYPNVYPFNPLIYNSPSEISLGSSTNLKNYELVQRTPLNSSYKADLEMVKPAASNAEAYVHSTPRLAASIQPASRFQVQHVGAADTPEKSHDDGRYHPQKENGDIRRAVPGEPGIDYPIFHSVPDTAFSCNGRDEGYYADIDSGCQVFHICSRNSLKLKNTFLCPNGSIFNQELLTCDWWNNVDCSVSEKYYSLNFGTAKAGRNFEANIYHFDTNLNKLQFSSKLDVFASTEIEREETVPITDTLVLVTMLLPPT